MMRLFALHQICVQFIAEKDTWYNPKGHIMYDPTAFLARLELEV